MADKRAREVSFGTGTSLFNQFASQFEFATFVCLTLNIFVAVSKTIFFFVHHEQDLRTKK